jgi:CBS domain containing-hemolysin-like protein
MDISVAFFCLSLSAVMSGLTLGLASIDRLELEIAAKQNPKTA